MNNTDGGAKLPLNGEISAIIDEKSVSSEIEKIKSEYSSSESFLIDSIKKICGDGMSIGGETLPMLWELLKLNVAYIHELDWIIDLADSDLSKQWLSRGYELYEFLLPSSFSPINALRPVRYGFFGRIIKRFRIKRELSLKKSAFIYVLNELSKLEDSANLRENIPFIAGGTLGDMYDAYFEEHPMRDAFMSANTRFSAGKQIDSRTHARALLLSDAVKRELSERGTDISALGLLPIGERIEIQDKKSPYTYPV